MREIHGRWICCDEELPPCDGTYEITNNPDWEEGPINRYFTALACYDGYGFEHLGIYRYPGWWRKYERPEKRYGKIKEEGA